MNFELLKKIYEYLGDELSKNIFMCRLMFSITSDEKWIIELIKLSAIYKEIWDSIILAKGDKVIYGAGRLGDRLWKVTQPCNWKVFVDSNPIVEDLNGVSVVLCENFIRNYSGESIFISTLFGNKEIYTKLISAGIPKEKIVNIGKMIEDFALQAYFDLEYLNKSEKDPIFIDGGAFDGMTSLQFLKWTEKKAKIFAFEPDEENFRHLQEKFYGKDHEIRLIKKGLWNNNGYVKFDASANVGSHVSEDGDVSIEVTTIDDVVKENKVTFIKMDIEGAEYEALIGSRKTIKRCHPTLAICVYHKAEDIWKIPQLLINYNPNYKFYLRHYYFGQYDTVLYAINQK